MMPTLLWSALLGIIVVLTATGLLVAICGTLAAERFRARPLMASGVLPAISVLKPLYGDEPLLEEALASICRQDYPDFEIVFGVQDAADPALLVVDRLRALFPDRDIAVVINAASHGANRKVCNLINMLPSARHEVLVFSDSDLHVRPDYLERLVAALQVPGTGLVTTLCSGLATVPGLAARLGAMHITHCFLPGALLSRIIGRQDCLGTTMALKRETLTRTGGLHGLVGHLADDNLLGQRVRQLGLRISLSDTIPATAVPERHLAALWQHELRWARTICALAPVGFAASIVQFPVFWAALDFVLSGGARWALLLLLASWLVRAAALARLGRALRGQAMVGQATRGQATQGQANRGQAIRVQALLLPLRELLSVGVIVASFLGARVVWRGHVMRADTGPSSRTVRLSVIESR